MAEKNMQFGEGRPKIPRRKPQWRLVLISDYGKIVAIPRHYTIFISVVLIIGAMIFATAATFSVYLKKHRENEDLKKSLDHFEKTVKNLEAEKEMLTAQLVLAGIDPEMAEAGTKGPKPVPVPETNGKSNFEKSAVEIKTKGAVHSRVSSKVASLANFEADYDEIQSKLKLNFMLNNNSDEKLSGYIMVLLKNPGKKTDSWMALPDSPIENGGPSDYKNGRYFEISNYKTIRFTVGEIEERDRFVEAEVYVYNQDGNLLLRKKFSLIG